MSEITTMEIPTTFDHPGDLPASAANLPEVDIGDGLSDPLDDLYWYDPGALDPTTDIDTTALADGYEIPDYPPDQLDRLPVVDRHRTPGDDTELVDMPAAMRDETPEPEATEPGGVQPPGPPFDEPPRRGSGEYDEGDDDEERTLDLTLVAATIKVARAYDAAETPVDDAGFSWLHPEHSEPEPDAEPGAQTEPEPVVPVDELDRILYGPVELRNGVGNVVGLAPGQDVTSPAFEPPQTEPAAPTIFGEVAAELEQRTQAEEVVAKARAAGDITDITMGPVLSGGTEAGAEGGDKPRQAAPVEAGYASVPAALAEPTTLAQVPTTEEIAPAIARAVEGDPGHINPKALHHAATLRRFSLATAAGHRAAAAAQAAASKTGEPRGVPGAQAGAASEEPAGTVELTDYPHGQQPTTATEAPRQLSPAERAAELARQSAVSQAQYFAETPPGPPPGVVEGASLDETLLVRVLRGLRDATGQADMTASEAAAGVEVTPADIAAAGDAFTAAANKLSGNVAPQPGPQQDAPAPAETDDAGRTDPGGSNAQ